MDEPRHIKFRREALELALKMDASDFIGNFNAPISEDTVYELAKDVAIILAGYDFVCDDNGRIGACVAGDQGYAATSINIKDSIDAIYAEGYAAGLAVGMKDMRQD